MKNKLKLFGIIAAVAVIGFSMASCGDGANGGGGGSGGGTYFTVTYHCGNSGAGIAPPRATVRAGDTITLPGAGRLTSPGTSYVLTWSTVNGEGGALYPTNFSYRVGGNVTLYARWVQREDITITVTGIDAASATIRLYTPAGGQFVGNNTWAWINDGEAVFNLNTIPGDYIVSLTTGDGPFADEHRSSEAVAITAGENAPIPFASLVAPPHDNRYRSGQPAVYDDHIQGGGVSCRGSQHLDCCFRWHIYLEAVGWRRAVDQELRNTFGFWYHQV